MVDPLTVRVVEIDVPGQPRTRLHVEVHHPDAPVTVLVSSGLGLPAACWYPVVARLPGMRVVLVDRPGIGGSSAWSSPPGGLADQVALLRLALDGAGGSGPVVVLGHSYGALPAEGFVRRHPELTGALVLVDPTDPAHEASRRQLEGLPSRLLRAAVAHRAVAATAGRVVALAVVALGTARRPPDPVPAEVRAAYRSPEHLDATLLELALIRGEARDLLAAERDHPMPDVPVVVMAAARAGGPVRRRRPAWLRRMAARARDLGPRAELTTVDGGHLLMLDSPGAVARAVESVVARRP